METLPVELITNILSRTEGWKERTSLRGVCRIWNDIICYYPWKETLYISTPLLFPPFYNAQVLSITSELTSELIENITLKYSNLHHVELAMRSDKVPKDRHLIFSLLGSIPNLKLSIGTASSWINVEDIKYLSNVVDLDISFCMNLSNEYLALLSNVKRINLSLRNIHYSNDLVTDDGLIHLVNVKEIDLSRRRNITDNGLSHLTQLKKLIINDCRITGSCFSNFSKLKTLSFKNCNLLQEDNLSELKSLTSIDLSNSLSVTNDVLSKLTHVKIVNISQCTGFSGLGLSYLESVEELYLDKCTQLIDRSLYNLSSSIKVLSLLGCSSITGEFLEYLPNSIISINIHLCNQIKPIHVENFTSKNPKIIVLSKEKLRISLSPNYTQSSKSL